MQHYRVTALQDFRVCDPGVGHVGMHPTAAMPAGARPRPPCYCLVVGDAGVSKGEVVHAALQCSGKLFMVCCCDLGCCGDAPTVFGSPTYQMQRQSVRSLSKGETVTTCVVSDRIVCYVCPFLVCLHSQNLARRSEQGIMQACWCSHVAMLQLQMSQYFVLSCAWLLNVHLTCMQGRSTRDRGEGGRQRGVG